MVQALRIAALASAAAVVTGHPVEQVITMLKKLADQAHSEGKTEEVAFTDFDRWCVNSQKKLNQAISSGKDNIERLSDEIDGHQSNVETLTADIEKLSQEVMDLDAAASAAQTDRDAGADLYSQVALDLKSTVLAVDECITILKNAESQTDQTGVLLQARDKVRSLIALVSYKTSPEQLSALQDFVSSPPLLAHGDRDAHVKVYDFKSGSVTEMLKQLSLKFQDEHTAAQTAETNALNNFALAKQARDNLKKAKEDSQAAKEAEKTATTEALNSATTDRTSATADVEADTKESTDTRSSCNRKTTEWEERSSTRAKEIEAIETAVAILAKVTGVRTDAPSNPLPPTSPVSTEGFLQLNKPQNRAEQASEILRKEATKVNSKALNRIADDVTTRVKHGDGHFDQVINAIEKMMFRLMNEQTKEDNHKAWCDQELSKTAKSIDQKTSKISELTVKIEEASARAALLKEEAGEADDMVGNIAAHIKDATEIRNMGKQENKVALKDSQDAQTAVANAIAVLQEFYKSSGAIQKEAWEFIQAPVKLSENAYTWESGYSSVADPKQQPGGIVTLLETVAQDFAAMEASTMAQEQGDQETYQQDMKDCKIEMARRQEESKQKNAESKRQHEKISQMQGQKKSVSGEKEATVQYETDLQPACTEGDHTYEDRKADRNGEVEALRSAQDLLKNAFEDKARDVSMQPLQPFVLENEPRSTSFLARTRNHAF